MALATDSRLGIYVIESELGAGGMGEVYRARDERLQRTVAIKLLLPTQAGDEERRARFLQEARTVSALNHPNIVTIHGIGTEDGRDYLVMEYLSGKTLDAVIPRQGLRLNLAVSYALQISEAMCAAHNAGIVHRDLKPANVRVSENGVVKVLDFGLAKSLMSSTASPTALTALPVETQRGSILGTAPYMSPEQAEGGSVDARSDIFSFGCMFYEMLTGISPFKRNSAISSLSAVLRDQPKPLSEVTKNLPAGADRIIQRCLQKNRDRRFQSWADLRVLLEELKEESEHPAPAITSQKDAPPRSRLKAVIGWSAGAALLMAAIAVFFWHGKSTAHSPPLTDSLLASLPGLLTHPNLSPDGNQVAFAWDGGTGGPTQIYLKVVGEGEPLRLTNGSDYASVPVWSPDGTSIAFLSSTSDTSGPEPEKSSPKTVTRVVVISALGGSGREIASYSAPPRDLSWSVDGKSILASTDKEVDTITVASKERRKILDAPANHMYRSATVSPDGHTLALIDSEGQYVTPNGAHIYLMNLADNGTSNGTPHLLPVTQDAVNSLAWTADSKALIFAGSMSLATTRFWRLPIDGRPETELNVGEEGLSPTIVGAAGRHGGRMVYLHVVADNDIWSFRWRMASRLLLFLSSPPPSANGIHATLPTARRSSSPLIRVASQTSGLPTQMVMS